MILMIVEESIPELSEKGIPHFDFEYPFKHQREFYENRKRDIILQSPTCSGKTDAVLFSFINDYLECGNRLKCLYLAPTRLLMQSQFENVTVPLSKHHIKHKILESGYSFAELFKHLWENDFIISSPDIIFYILLRKKGSQHIEFLYNEFVNSLHSVVFDELHLFDTYTLVNINNLIRIIKNIKADVRIYVLSATLDIEDIISFSQYLKIRGISKTKMVRVSAKEVNYWDSRNVSQFLKENNYLKNTIYISNSVDRAIRLHNEFSGSSILVGKMWYENTPSKGRDDQIRENLDMSRNGALTFATSVFRQGVDLSLKRLITEDPLTAQDAIQTFGRCGRHEESEFIILSAKSRVVETLKSNETVTRGQFESFLSNSYMPREYEEMKRMMIAMWFKLYKNTRLKPQIDFSLTKEMQEAYDEFEEFLPDTGFREPLPAIKYNDLTINLFEVLRFKDAYRNIFPSEDSFVVGELRDGGRLTRREYRKAGNNDLPDFTLVDSKKYKSTDYYRLTLKLRDITFRTNARVGNASKYLYKYKDSTKLIPIEKSFEPAIFFE
jgi:superfamily II DNA/RNA helicase